MAFGCGVELPGLEPPTNTLYYPSSTTDLGNGELLIVNGNFDLKFKTAWLNVVDLSGALESGQDEASIESFMTGENLRILSHPGECLSTTAIFCCLTEEQITEARPLYLPST